MISLSCAEAPSGMARGISPKQESSEVNPKWGDRVWMDDAGSAYPQGRCCCPFIQSATDLCKSNEREKKENRGVNKRTAKELKTRLDY